MDKPTGLGAMGSLDYTVLLCENVDTMAAFYRDVLGFELRSAVAGRWAEFRIGGSTLAMRTRSRPYDGSAPDGASVHLAFRVPPPDIDICAAQLADLGIELIEPISVFEDFGHRALFFADPENNVIEIYADI